MLAPYAKIGSSVDTNYIKSLLLNKVNYADIKSTQSKEVWSKRNNEEKDVIFKKISNSLKGKSNISLKNKKHTKIKCIYCDKQGGLNNMKRYHFDNCKYKNNGI